MGGKENIQDRFLEQLRQGGIPVTVYTANGFQMKGRIVAHDQFTLLVEDAAGGQSLVYKSAVSTITRAKPDGPR